MYVCMHVCMHACMHVCIHVYMYTICIYDINLNQPSYPHRKKLHRCDSHFGLPKLIDDEVRRGAALRFPAASRPASANTSCNPTKPWSATGKIWNVARKNAGLSQWKWGVYHPKMWA